MSKLKLFPREISGKKVKNIRSEGMVPAVLYGPGFESTSVSVDAKEFSKVFEEAGYSNLIDVEIEGGSKERVILKEVQEHPLQDYVIHASMYVIDKNKEITADIPLEFVGEAPAQDKGIGFIVSPVETITVVCLPDNLPSVLQVDISTLEDIGDSISIGDVKLPEGVELDTDMEEGTSVIYVAAPQKLEDLEPATDEEGEEGEESEEGEEGEGSEGEEQDAE